MTERRGVLLATLLSTMTASSFQIFAFAVLAVEIITDLGISRTAIGVLGSVNTFVGAVTAPATGRLTDRMGARRAVVLALVISGIGMGLMGLADSWWPLVLSAAVSGIPQGWGNPATNALIAERVPAPAQGTVTGIKQSGVQFGIFLSGLTLPALALWVGWRGSAWVFAAAFAVTAVAVALLLGDKTETTATESDAAATTVRTAPTPAVPTPATTSPTPTGSTGTDPDVSDGDTAVHPPTGNGSAVIPPFIWRLTIYAFSLGTAGGAVSRFFPLWANEVVGLSTSMAGALVAIGGLMGIVSRILAARLARWWMAPAPMLGWLALLGAAYCVMLMVTTTVGTWILWPSTVFNAVGIGAWNAVAMLAVITAVPRRAAGRASGRVMVGFLGGLAVGSPVAGWVVDQWGSYQPVWIAAMVLSVVSAAVVWPRTATDRAAAFPAAG